MTKSFTKVRWSLAVITIATVGSTCSTKRPDDVVSMRENLSTGNGLGQNGLTTNGMWANGMWANGMWANGMWANGMWANGMWANGMWANGLTGTEAVPGQVLRSSAYARQLLQYIYSCAMPAGTYDTALDPNEAAPLVCASDTDCDVGYSCLASKCVIPLQGMGANNSGMGINDDLTTWWGQPAPGGATDPSSGKWGKCDETCQRWVSACVLARTNAYGVHVPISLRAPSDAPDPIKAALEVGTTERIDYTLREGAFYGNIFATTPVGSPPPASYTGPATGAIMSTPAFHACAGPGSNIPQITKRFCSSQGDQVVIQVPGVCLTNTSQSGVCVGDDTNAASETFGAISGCRTGTAPSSPQYNQVITVFLQHPIAVCGNAVCEDDGTPASPETAASCPSDCHPGTWVKNYDPTFQTLQTQIPPLDDPFPNFTDYSMAALGPDDTVVVVGDTTAVVDLDGVLVPMGGSSGGAGILVKYNADGSYAWPDRGVRFNNTLTTAGLLRVTGITVAASGNITVVGTTGTTLWFSTFGADGTQLVTRTFALGATVSPGRSVSVDSLGNTYIAGYLNGNGTFPTSPSPTVLSGGYGHNVFLMKVSPAGAVVHAQLVPGNLYVASLTNDTNDNTLLTTWQSSDTSGPTLVKKCADPTLASCADGSIAWQKDFGGLGAFTAVAADATGNVYAGGFFGSNTNFGGGARPMTGFPPSLVKYDRNGVYQWDKQATVICPPAPAVCTFGSYVYPTNISFDPAGNVVLATWGTPSIGGGIDFGFGMFPTYATSNIFLSAYQPAVPGSLKWAKQIPGVLGVNVRGIGLDSLGRVVVSGTFGGSMTVDDVMLVTGLPEDPFTVNPFIASFGGPPPGDNQAPVIGNTIDPSGNPIYTVPHNIYVQATSAAGAKVFYMPPTAIDDAHAGTSVVCWPPPNTTFPIGTTTVTCTASDPGGNDTSASFTVTVADKVGPIFTPVADISVETPNPGGATVPYTAPTATDQISGPRAVTCTPPPGSLFTVGNHTVTCTASDASGNQSSVTFAVKVTAVYGAPCTSTAQCATGTCVDGVCCNTTAASCGQCQACNTAGALGSCAPTSGGTCDDGNACTQSDSCQAGTCTGTNPVTCAATDQCHVAGTCNPSTGTCSDPAAPDGTTCTDGNVCTAGDVCAAGFCAGGGAASCDDQNPCTVDSCDAIGGCVHTPGNAGVTCRAAGSACDSAEICTGASASCPVSSDKLPPALAPGTNQNVVGNCSGNPVAFAVPALVNSSCEGGTNVTCTWTSGGSHGTCARNSSGTSLPGNRTGAFTVSCTAKDAAGNVSPAVVFTVTVLKPLTVRIQPPLSGDNNTVSNIVKLGSTVPTKVLLYACGTNVTKMASVTATIGTTYVSSGGATTSKTVPTCNDTPDTSGLMTLDGAYYRYNLSTKGLSVTAGVPGFYQENITVTYKSAPSVVVGTDTIQIDLK